jgi:hypothetical protein
MEPREMFLGKVANVAQGLFNLLLPSYNHTGQQGIEVYH